MVIDILSPDVISAGVRLIEQLDNENVVVDGALWLFDEEQRNWKLVLSLPVVDREGPRAGYRKVQSALARLREEPRVELADVVVIQSGAPLMKGLRSFVHTGPGISSIRLTNNVINGHVIPDAHVYRLQ